MLPLRLPSPPLQRAADLEQLKFYGANEITFPRPLKYDELSR